MGCCEGGGGTSAEPFIVHIHDIDNEGDFDGWYVDESYEDIKGAIESGKSVYGKWNSNVFQLTTYSFSQYTGSVAFQNVQYTSSGTRGNITNVQVSYVRISSADQVTGFYSRRSFA